MSGWEPAPSVIAQREWGVPLRWARDYPDWPTSLRRWLAGCRALGLTQITILPERYEVVLIATRPGEPAADWA